MREGACGNVVKGVRLRATQQFVHSAQWGAAGFGIGFATVGIITGLLGYYMKDITRLCLLLVLSVFASSLGSAMLGFAGKPKAAARQCALAGAAGCGCGYLVSAMVSLILMMAGCDPFVIAPLACIVIGGSTGMFLGATEKSRKYVVMSTLAGAIGGAFFNLAGLGLGCFFLVFEGSIPLCCEVRDSIAYGLWGAIGGVIIGACLGVAHAMVHPRGLR